MSNENLDQDALATEEMLKMFEGIEVDDAQTSDEAEANELLNDLSLDDSLTGTMDNAMALNDELDTSLPAMELADTPNVELLEIADHNETAQQVESLDTPESADVLEGLSVDTVTDDRFTQSNDDEFPVADLANISTISEVDTLEVDELAMNKSMNDEVAPTALATTSSAMSLTEATPIAEHLQAVVANAIQALQDWMQLRQEGEHKGPQQSLAQLDVLLDTVTTQQQQLAEQLANSAQQQLTQISSALGVSLATPQTLGWTDEDWRIKAQQVADKTDDISQRNAKIRQELAHL